jgi:hypothetical protein
MSGFLQRLLGRFRGNEIRREQEETRMSPAERRRVETPIEDLQADRVVEERLGGTDPERLEE